MKPVEDEGLDNAVTTLCDSPEDVAGTVVGYATSEDCEGVAAIDDVEESFEDVVNKVNELTEEDNEALFIIGNESEDDECLSGLEVLIKLI